MLANAVRQLIGGACFSPDIFRDIFSEGGIDDDFGIKRLKEDKYVTVAKAFYGLPNVLEVNGTEIQRDGHKKIQIRPEQKWDAFYRRVRAKIPAGVGNIEAVKMCEQGRVPGMIPTRHSSEVAKRYKALHPGERDETSKAVRLRKNKPGPTIRGGNG